MGKSPMVKAIQKLQLSTRPWKALSDRRREVDIDIDLWDVCSASGKIHVLIVLTNHQPGRQFGEPIEAGRDKCIFK